MGATPEIAVIDDLIRKRLDEILPQKIEEKLKEIEENKTPSLAIIATKGTLDWAYPPFILASTAAALGWDVTIFFTFYGLQSGQEGYLRPEGQPARQSRHADENAFRPGLVQEHQLEHPEPHPGRHSRIRVGCHLADAADDQEQRRCQHLANCASCRQEAGVKFVVCQMTVELFGFSHDDFVEGMDYVGAASFLPVAQNVGRLPVHLSLMRFGDAAGGRPS